MKSLSMMMLGLFISISAHAKIVSYNCEIITPNDELKKSFSVPFENCKLTSEKMYDVCSVEQQKLIIPENPLYSLLFTSKGETLEVFCTEFDDGIQEPTEIPAPTTPAPQNCPGSTPEEEEACNPPEEGEEQEQQQQEQQEESEQQEQRYPRRGDGPGHGGSNIRGRGFPGEMIF